MTLKQFLAWEDWQELRRRSRVFCKGEDWLAKPVSGEGAVLRMRETGVETPLAERNLDADLDSG